MSYTGVADALTRCVIRTLLEAEFYPLHMRAGPSFSPVGISTLRLTGGS